MNTNIEKAMILAAGEGTRLRPLTSDTPKSLLPVGNTPIIVHQLRWLKRYGIKRVVINLFHKGDQIKAALGDGGKFGMEISYSPEDVLLGTAGGVKRMESFFSEVFCMINRAGPAYKMGHQISQLIFKGIGIFNFKIGIINPIHDGFEFRR